MDQQGSTPDIIAGGQQSHSPQSSADISASAQPSQSQTLQPENGDLFGNLQFMTEQGQTRTGAQTDTPSQTTPQTENTPQADTPNPVQQQPGDSVDPELVRWASSQNIDLSNPTPEQVQKLVKRLRDTQSALHQEKTKQVQQIDDTNYDPVQAVSNRLARYEFFEQTPEAKALEPKMIDYVLNLKNQGQDQAAAFYADPANWNHLYTIVKGQGTQPDTGDLIEQGRQVERENLAKAQQASAPSAAATSSAPAPQLSQDEQIAKMSPAEYNEWRKTHNPFAIS